MSKPSSGVAICNIALAQIGERRIAAIVSPTTQSEITMAALYDQARQGLIAKFIWPFAKERVLCNRITTAPLFDYSDAYQLPNDFITLLRIGEDESCKYKYDIQGKTLLLNNKNAATLKVRYQKDIEDVNTWSVLFRSVMPLEIALLACYQYNKKESTVERINKLLALSYQECISVESQQRPIQIIDRSRLVNARRQPNSDRYSTGYFWVE